MTYAPPYEPGTSFADDESSQAAGRAPVRTPRLDLELSNIASSINALLASAMRLQRDDDKLLDLLVEPYALAEQTRAMMAAGCRTPRGAWAPNTAYALTDLVQYQSVAYMCALAHNSGLAFTYGLWLPISGDGTAAASAQQAALSVIQAAVSAASADSDAATVAASVAQALQARIDALAAAVEAQNAAASIAGLSPVNLSAGMLAFLATDAPASGAGGGLLGYSEALVYFAGSIGSKLREQRFTPYGYGAFPGVSSSANDAAMLAFFAALATRPGKLPKGRWICNSRIAHDDGVTIDLEIETGAILDLSGCVTPSGQADWTVGSDAAGITVLPALAASFVRSSDQVIFASAPGLNVGDLFIIYDQTDSSWNAARTYYRAGDFCRVKSISGNTVTTEFGAFDDYLTTDNLRIVKLAMCTVCIDCRGAIQFSTSNTSSGLLVWNGYACVLNGILARGSYRAQLDLRRCYNTEINGLKSFEYLPAADLNYCLAIQSSFNVKVSGAQIHNTRHAITLTGGDYSASIPNRRCGVYNSHVSGDYFALDQHGCCEFCEFIGNDAYGGVSVGGNHSLVQGGRIYTNRNTTDRLGVGYWIREPLGANHTLSGVEIVCLDAASGGVGIIEQNLFNPLRGGVLTVLDVKVTSPVVAQTVLAHTSISGTSIDEVSIVMDGLVYHRSVGYSPNIQIEGNDTSAYRSVVVRNMAGASVRMQNLKSAHYIVENCDIDNAVNDGVRIEPLAYSQQQIIELSNVTVRDSQAGGLIIAGPGTSYLVRAVFENCTSLSNGRNSGTVDESKSSIRAYNLAAVVVKGNVVGDLQATPTQSWSFYLDNIGTLVDTKDNVQIFSSRPIHKAGIGSTVYPSAL